MTVSPSFLQQQAALETLRAAGWTVQAPAAMRLQLLTIAEVAELLRFSTGTVKRLVADGHFPGAVLVGTDTRIPQASLESFIARQPAASKATP